MFLTINDLNLYYEIHGEGTPLVALHGGFGMTGMFAPILPQLSANRQVIALDLQGHGRTADIDRPLSYQSMADDVAALLAKLGIQQADLFGYSLGGGVALQTAIRHPALTRKLVVVSAPCKSAGWYPEVLSGFEEIDAAIAKTWIGSPMHQAYVSVAPDAEGWTALVEKLGQMLRQSYDWSEQVARLEAPTMIVVGDSDGVRSAHAVEFFALLGGGQRDAGWDGAGMPNARLAVLPGTTHYDILNSPLLAPVTESFLAAPDREMG